MPTLVAQISAISKAYGLPSTGGIALYLLSVSTTLPNSGFAEEGPRIGEEAWGILWGSLFASEQSRENFGESQVNGSANSTFDPASTPISPALASTPSTAAMSRNPSSSSTSFLQTRSAATSHRSTQSFETAVIVGKLEFDIDRRENGRGRWYNNWITASTLTARLPSCSAAESANQGGQSDASESHPSDLAVPRRALCLPSFVKQRVEQPMSHNQDISDQTREFGEASHPISAHYSTLTRDFSNDSTSTLPAAMSHSLSDNIATAISVASEDESGCKAIATLHSKRDVIKSISFRL